jgi:hypothetical protein
MANIVAVEPRKLPKLEALYEDIEGQSYLSEIAVFMNQPPSPKWIKKNKFANDTLYIPIERQEFMMTYFFGDWYTEVISYKELANSITAHVRVHYLHPSGEWRWADGVGAVPIQIKKEGNGATDFANMNSNAVQIGLPAAKSYAFKDAVESLGKIFGKDLNRKDGMDYYNILGADGNRFEISEEQAAEIEALLTTDALRESLLQQLKKWNIESINTIPMSKFKTIKIAVQALAAKKGNAV